MCSTESFTCMRRIWDEMGIDHCPFFCAAFLDCIDKSRLPVPEPFDPEELERFLSEGRGSDRDDGRRSRLNLPS